MAEQNNNYLLKQKTSHPSIWDREKPWQREYPWYEKAVFYHIYPLGMCGAPKENTKEPCIHRIREVEKWIPHMQRLGVTALYIGPLFESMGHGYETNDYYRVDSRLGDNDDLKHLVQECHKNGIYVVLDGVFNHSGRGFFAFQDLKEKRESSVYRDWYCKVNFYNNNEFQDGFSYEAWHGFNILPRFNLKHPAVKQYLLEVIAYWIKEFEIDGIRLDCADVLDFDFMKEMRQFCQKQKQDFWLMGEVIHGDYSRWVNPEMLHSVTNYEMHKGLYSGHNDQNYFEIAHTIRRLYSSGGIARNGLLYTFVENHDVNRLVNKLTDPNNIYPVYLLAYTLPGIPSIYYGGEFALSGAKDKNSDDGVRPELHIEDFCDWNKLQDSKAESTDIYLPQYQKLLSFLIRLGELKKTCEPLTGGEYKELFLTNKQYAFARIQKDSAVVTVVNNAKETAKISVPLPFSATEASDIEAEELWKAGDKENWNVKNGILEIELSCNSGALFYVQKIN